MGMYTELFVSTRVKNDPEVVATIKWLIGEGDEPASLPDHPFFKTDRMRQTLTGGSYYFVPRSVKLFDYDEIGRYWVLITRSDLKNYDNEIEKFISWLDPHLDLIEGEMIGYSRYEECDAPTILYKGPAA